MTDAVEPATASYPGQTAKPREILDLATEYAKAAERLLELCRKGEPLSQAPFRLAAIHAIELYLNAVMLACGLDATQVRGLQHDLKKRAASVASAGLVLRQRTAAHIHTLTDTREYQVTRYDPQTTAGLSQLNRLEATLKEVRRKALAIVERAHAQGPLGELTKRPLRSDEGQQTSDKCPRS
jgi:hypothetical protein